MFLIPSLPKQLNFSDPVAYEGGGFGMQCIDMNNDGYPDIVTSSGIIWINDGNGEFPNYWYLNDTDGFYPIIVDDFNRDDYMDVYYYGAGGLTLGLGNGLGNFNKSYYPQQWFYDYISADINSDGYPDIIGISMLFENPNYDTTSYFAFVINDGSGHLNDTTLGGYLTGYFQKIAHSDVDNDGDSDILIISHPAVTPNGAFGLDGLAVFMNNGEGNFTECEQYPANIYFSVYFPKFIYSSDFNNDSFTDIAVLGDMGGAVTLNIGNGYFGSDADTANIREFWGAENYAPFTGGDFNGDNWIDLAVSGYGIPFEPQSPREYIIKENYHSYFNSSNSYYDTLGNEILIFADAAVDLNNDGCLDLIHSGTGVYITLSTDITPSVDDYLDLPREFILYQNYPNPFNPITTINYQVPVNGLVLLKVYDLLGREIAILVNEVQSTGIHTVNFDASNLPSGVYIYSLRSNDFMQNKKMTLLK